MKKNIAQSQANQFFNLEQSLFIDLAEASQVNISGGNNPKPPSAKALYNFVDATMLSNTAQSKGT